MKDDAKGKKRGTRRRENLEAIERRLGFSDESVICDGANVDPEEKTDCKWTLIATLQWLLSFQPAIVFRLMSDAKLCVPPIGSSQAVHKLKNKRKIKAAWEKNNISWYFPSTLLLMLLQASRGGGVLGQTFSIPSRMRRQNYQRNYF